MTNNDLQNITQKPKFSIPMALFKASILRLNPVSTTPYCQATTYLLGRRLFENTVDIAMTTNCSATRKCVPQFA